MAPYSILMNDGHMDIQEFWLKQLKKWSKEDLLGWGCFVWDWIWGICIFLKSRSNIEFSTINHHHLCHHFKPCAALLCSCTISGYWYQQAQASLCWPVPPPNILTGKTFCKTEEKKTKMICQVLFPNILLQTNFKAALQFSGSLEKFHN